MTPARLLLLGATGQLGRRLAPLLADLGDVAAPPRRDCDLADPSSLRAAVRSHAPDVIVNCAAWTDVDAAERDPAGARAVNATAPALLADEARRRGCVLVHLSTDHVFDGKLGRPLREDDEPRPVNAYGASKLEGERAVASVEHHLVLRTSWLHDTPGRGFVAAILREAGSGRLRVVDDQVGCPTWAGDLAVAIRAILDPGAAAAGERARRHPGTYHLSGAGQATRHELAAEIVAIAHPGSAIPVERARTEDLPAAARRPPDSRLDCGLALRTFGTALPDWRDALRRSLTGLR